MLKKVIHFLGVICLSIIIISIAGTIVRGKLNKSISQAQQLSQLEKEVQKYKEEEQKIRERQKELENLIEPEIILEQLQEAGKIISYEGNVGYNGRLKEKTILGTRELYMELKYKFGISMDLQYIEITDIQKLEKPNSYHIFVKIPKDKLELEYLSLLANESKLDDDISLFVSKFKTKDYQEVLKIAENKTRERIINTNEIWTNAHENMKMEICDLLEKISNVSSDFKFSIIQFVD